MTARGDLAWIMALYDAETSLDLSGVARLLRDETINMTMSDRRGLAELLAPEAEGAKVEARMHSRIDGRGPNTHRDYQLYCDVASFKLSRGLKKMPEAEYLRIGERYGFCNMETIRSALKNGKRLSDDYDTANEEIEREERGG